MKSPDFTEFVTVLDPNEQYTTPAGKKIKAASLYHQKSIVTLPKLIGETFGCTEHQIHLKSFLREVLFIMNEFNQLPEEKKPDIKQITPIIVSGSEMHYLLPKEQEEPMVELLKKNAPRLEPYLPFRVTASEMKQLKVQDQEVKDRIRIRMVRLGLMSSAGIPKKDALINVINIINHPSTWEVLLRSELSVSTKSDFQKFFRTSVYRKALNYHRHQKVQTRKEEKSKEAFPLLNEGPLKAFFHEYPPESEEAERLLKSLSDKQREAFIDRYLNNGLSNHSVLPILAKSKLEGIIKLPQEEWPKPNMINTAKQLMKNEYRFFINFFEHLTEERQQEYAISRFEEGLENQDIAKSLKTTTGAIKSLGARFCEQLMSRAMDRGILKIDDLEWGKYHYTGIGKHPDRTRLYAENFLPAEEAASKLNMSLSSIYRLLRQEILPAHMKNGVWLISQEALDNYQPLKRGRPSTKKPS